MFLRTLKLEPARLLTAPELAWQETLKKATVKFNLLTDIDILLMAEKGIKGGICHAIYRYAKATNNYVKDYDKNKESSYLRYWDVDNLSGWEKLIINGLKIFLNLMRIS